MKLASQADHTLEPPLAIRQPIVGISIDSNSSAYTSIVSGQVKWSAFTRETWHKALCPVSRQIAEPHRRGSGGAAGLALIRELQRIALEKTYLHTNRLCEREGAGARY